MVNTIDNLSPVRWVPDPSQPSLLALLRESLVRVGWARRQSSHDATAAAHDQLAELDAHTLADIGAPEAMLERALARSAARRQEREGLALGLAAGAWHHW